MKYSLITALFLFFLNINFGFSQCRSFAKEYCKPKLENFAHDGNYNGIILNSGEEVELHKAFFSGQRYRIVVCGEEHLPLIHFKITDADFNVIFDNKEDHFVDYFDFELENSKTLIISLDFVKDDDPERDMQSGCVSILFGMEL